MRTWINDAAADADEDLREQLVGTLRSDVGDVPRDGFTHSLFVFKNRGHIRMCMGGREGFYTMDVVIVVKLYGTFVCYTADSGAGI